MSEIISEVFTSELLRYALLATVFTGLLAPVAGCFLLLRKAAFLGVALPQVSAAGMAAGGLVCGALGVGFGGSFCSHCANLVKPPAGGDNNGGTGTGGDAALPADTGFAPLDPPVPGDGGAVTAAPSWFAANGGVFVQMAVALAITFAALALLSQLERRAQNVAGRGGAGGDARHGALYVLAGAGAVLLLAANPFAEGNFANLLRGEIVSVGVGDLWLVVAALAPATLLLALFRHEFLWAGADPAFAAASGRAVFFWNALLAALLGLVICGTVYIAGPLATLGALLLPAMSAHTLAPNMRAFFLLAPPLGLLGALAGYTVAAAADAPAGMTIIAAHGVILALAKIFSLAATVARRMRDGVSTPC